MGRPHVVLRPELVGSPRVTLAGVPEPTNTLPRCETRALQVRGGALCKYRNGNVSATAVEIAHVIRLLRPCGGVPEWLSMFRMLNKRTKAYQDKPGRNISRSEFPGYTTPYELNMILEG